MEWIIKISGKPNQRIVVNYTPINLFNPVDEHIEFLGEYKPKNKDWCVFVKKNIKITEKTSSEIKDTLFEIVEEMNKKIETYKDLSDVFNAIKEIEILDDTIEDESYGTL